jgi:hypothetical protein
MAAQGKGGSRVDPPRPFLNFKSNQSKGLRDCKFPTWKRACGRSSPTAWGAGRASADLDAVAWVAARGLEKGLAGAGLADVVGTGLGTVGAAGKGLARSRGFQEPVGIDHIHYKNKHNA